MSIRYTFLQEWDLPPDTAQDILKDGIIIMSGEESKVYAKELRRVVAYNVEHGYAVELLTDNLICSTVYRCTQKCAHLVERSDGSDRFGIERCSFPRDSGLSRAG